MTKERHMDDSATRKSHANHSFLRHGSMVVAAGIMGGGRDDVAGREVGACHCKNHDLESGWIT
jgi:hypothetical protein